MPKTVEEICAIMNDDVHRAWILKATDEQLDEYIFKVSGNSSHLRPVAEAERNRRHFKHLSKAAEPHWTIIRSYRLLQISVGLATLAIIITILAWWFPRAVEKETIPHFQVAHSNSATSFYIPMLVLEPTNSSSAKPAQQQTSPPSIFSASEKNLSNSNLFQK